MSRPAAITLLIPCYNAARYLPRLADSVRAQTMPFAEILCYDDGSTDQTLEVTRALGWRILTPNTNAGPAAARNRLLAAATTDWVHFHDADDLLEPRFVERMSALLDAQPDTDVAVCDMDWIGEQDRTLRKAWRYSGERLSSDPLGETIRNPVGVIACVYRRTTLAALGGFDEGFHTWEDGDLHVRIAAAGARFQVVPEILAIGLRHDRGASADQTAMENDRVRQLEHYVVTYPGCSAVAEEAERMAIRLFDYNPRDVRVDRLLAVCRRAGHAVPTTRHRLWRTARAVLPIKCVLRLRALARRLPCL